MSITTGTPICSAAIKIFSTTPSRRPSFVFKIEPRKWALLKGNEIEGSIRMHLILSGQTKYNWTESIVADTFTICNINVQDCYETICSSSTIKHPGIFFTLLYMDIIANLLLFKSCRYKEDFEEHIIGILLKKDRTLFSLMYVNREEGGEEVLDQYEPMLHTLEIFPAPL